MHQNSWTFLREGNSAPPDNRNTAPGIRVGAIDGARQLWWQLFCEPDCLTNPEKRAAMVNARLVYQTLKWRMDSTSAERRDARRTEEPLKRTEIADLMRRAAQIIDAGADTPDDARFVTSPPTVRRCSEELVAAAVDLEALAFQELKGIEK